MDTQMTSFSDLHTELAQAKDRIQTLEHEVNRLREIIGIKDGYIGELHGWIERYKTMTEEAIKMANASSENTKA